MKQNILQLVLHQLKQKYDEKRERSRSPIRWTDNRK